MADNLAYQEEPREELLGGKVLFMSPRPTVNHNRVAFNIAIAFERHLRGKTCEAFADGTDVYLTEKDRVVPDVMIVCNPDIIRRDGIHGAPDLMVEVLSPATAKRDRGYKMRLYERCGVREYWLVDPEGRSVETYLLQDGAYRLDEVYVIFPDYVQLSDEERKEYKDEVKVSLYEDFFIPLEDIFRNLF